MQTEGPFPSPEETEQHQLVQLRRLLQCLLEGNAFYTPRLQAAGLDGPLESLAAFKSRLPLTQKSELVRDQVEHQPYGTNLTQPLSACTRFHQTCSTTGAPVLWLDDQESWSWMVAAWQDVLLAAQVTACDRVLVAFSFGPFIGLWLGFEAAQALGCLCLPAAAMTTVARLEAILAQDVSVLLCTPTYALRLGQVAREQGLDLSSGKVRAIVVGGEPGASVPAQRALIQSHWPGAELFDHYGLTEVGPVTLQCRCTSELVHAMEARHICEVLDRGSGLPVPEDGEHVGELVLTNLGRMQSPALRYRTGDLVRPLRGAPCPCGRQGLSFVGGILGRLDDMVVVRGVNLYPSAVDQIVRSQTQVSEYQVHVGCERGMTEIHLTIEPERDADPKALCLGLQKALRQAFGLRMLVTSAAEGSLPRFELKARRWIRD